MNFLHLTVCFLLQAVCLVSSSPQLKSIAITVNPNEYNPSVSFQIVCTVEVSPVDSSPFTVVFKHNDSAIAWWTSDENALDTYKWGRKATVGYITSGVASYPNFTATIRGNVPGTAGNYKCLLGDNQAKGWTWQANSISTPEGWNTESEGFISRPVPPPTVFSLLFSAVIKHLLGN